MHEQEALLPHTRLEIVVATGCPGCDEARRLAREVRERFPTLEVKLIDLNGQNPAPRGIVATPAYLLGGSVISLGNPSLDTLIRAITVHQTQGRQRRGQPDLARAPERRKATPGMRSDTITVYGTVWCEDCRQAKQVFDRRGVRYAWIDIDTDPVAEAVVLHINGGKRSVPTIVFPDGSVLVEPSARTLAERLEELRDGTGEAAPALDVDAPGSWRGRTLAAGVIGAIVASFCCLPMATAIALGVSLNTIATLSQLLAYQRFFQLGGVALAGLAVWWTLRRSCASCSLSEAERERVPVYIFGAFAAGFAVLNLMVIPLLEQLPHVLAGR